jgi:methyl-galactoside transport system substrate-binding protein
MTLVSNINDGASLMDNTSSLNVDTGVAKIRVPYAKVTG